MEIARSIMEGDLDWNERTAQRFYNCALCGSCDNHCDYVNGTFSPMEIFMMMRRELVNRGLGPLSTQKPLVKSTEQYKNPFAQKVRGKSLPFKAKKVDESTEVLFYVGCALEFDPTSSFITKETASILNKAKVNWGILKDEEVCCGFPVYELGCEELFGKLAKENIDRINQTNVKTIVTSCTACQTAMKREWPRYGELKAKPMHISEYAAQLLKEGRLKVKGHYDKKVTIHDPCQLGRFNGIYEEPRDILKAIPGVDFREMERHHEEAYCCGAGGGLIALDPEWTAQTATERLEEAIDHGAEVLVIPSCPTCYMNFDMALHGYAGAAKLYEAVWSKVPAAAKFMGVAHKLATPFMKMRKKVDIEIMDETQLLNMVT
jgi:Fe-S oxidoreductase